VDKSKERRKKKVLTKEEGTGASGHKRGEFRSEGGISTFSSKKAGVKKSPGISTPTPFFRKKIVAFDSPSAGRISQELVPKTEVARETSTCAREIEP